MDPSAHRVLIECPQDSSLGDDVVRQEIEVELISPSPMGSSRPGSEPRYDGELDEIRLAAAHLVKTIVRGAIALDTNVISARDPDADTLSLNVSFANGTPAPCADKTTGLLDEKADDKKTSPLDRRRKKKVTMAGSYPTHSVPSSTTQGHRSLAPGTEAFGRSVEKIPLDCTYETATTSKTGKKVKCKKSDTLCGSSIHQPQKGAYGSYSAQNKKEAVAVRSNTTTPGWHGGENKPGGRENNECAPGRNGKERMARGNNDEKEWSLKKHKLRRKEGQCKKTSQEEEEQCGGSPLQEQLCLSTGTPVHTLQEEETAEGEIVGGEGWHSSKKGSPKGHTPRPPHTVGERKVHRDNAHAREQILSCKRKRTPSPVRPPPPPLTRETIAEAIILQECYRVAVSRGPAVNPQHDYYPETSQSKHSPTRRHDPSLCRVCAQRPPGSRSFHSDSHERPTRKQEHALLPRLGPPPPLPPAVYLFSTLKSSPKASRSMRSTRGTEFRRWRMVT